MSLAEVKNLKVWFPVKQGFFNPPKYIRAVDGVSFSIENGETIGLVGESGCGKSTIGRTLVRLEEPTEGEFIFNNVDVFALKGKKLRSFRKHFQMIFQDPYGSLNPRMTIYKLIDEVLCVHTKLNKEERLEKIVRLIEMVGLSADTIYRYPHQFSGGQKQRIGIARVLAVEPELIIADEPISALDVSVQAQIINLLEEIQKAIGVAYLFIAHDLAVVEHISHNIMVMYLGKIVESGSTKDVCANPVHPYTQALISAVPVIDPATKKKRIILQGDIPSPLEPPSGCPFHTRCPYVRDKCRKETPELVAVNKNNNVKKRMSEGIHSWVHKCACHFPLM